MYVIVVYDADPEERKSLRTVLEQHLHWIQNSVFAGEMTKTAAMDLYDAINSCIKNARVTFWLFDRKPTTFHMGRQDDREEIFI